MYISYGEYLSLGGVELDDTTFGEYEFQAETVINYVTFDRLLNEEVIPMPVKRVITMIIKRLKRKDDSLNMGASTTGVTSGVAYDIKSQSNDGVSVTYQSMPAELLCELCDKDIQYLVKKYLSSCRTADGRSLLYRGLYPGE